MSVRAVNVGILNPLRLLEASEYLEGPPFYSQLRLKLSISGSRSHTDSGGVTRSESLSYIKEITLDRAAMEFDATPASPAPANEGLTTFKFDYGVFTLAPPSSGGFSIATERWDMDFVGQQIGRQTLLPFYDQNFTPEICGTWSETGNSDPDLDDSGNIEIDSLPIPTFFLSTASGAPEDYRKPADRWAASIIVPTHFGPTTGSTTAIDISGWTNAQWRSKLGVNSVTYTESYWYDSEATTDVTATFEWELS